MATRQYIGARYVIKVYTNSQNPDSAEWEANTSFEPLTMVTYQNSSYLSKKAVPATIGNPVSNPTYWACTGYYNGQIASLQQAVNSLQNEINNLKTHKYLFVGDSYGDNTGEWPYIVKNSLAIADENFNNVCVSGAGFIDYGGGTYLEQVTNFNGDKESITDIILCGGLNDSRYSNYNDANTALSPAIIAFNNYVRANYPNATVYIGYIGSCLYDASYYATVPLDNRKICKYIYETQGASYYWRVLGGISNVMHSSTYNFGADHIHPSALGSRLIGDAISTILGGGQYHCCYPKSIITTLETGFSGNFAASYEIEGDITKLEMNGNLLCPNKTIGDSYVDIAELSQVTFGRPVDISTQATLDFGGGSSPRFVLAEVTLRFYNNKLQLRIMKLNSAGSAYETYTFGNAGAIYITEQLAISIPTFNIN